MLGCEGVAYLAKKKLEVLNHSVFLESSDPSSSTVQLSAQAVWWFNRQLKQFSTGPIDIQPKKGNQTGKVTGRSSSVFKTLVSYEHTK